MEKYKASIIITIGWLIIVGIGIYHVKRNQQIETNSIKCKRITLEVVYSDRVDTLVYLLPKGYHSLGSNRGTNNFFYRDEMTGFGYTAIETTAPMRICKVEDICQ